MILEVTCGRQQSHKMGEDRVFESLRGTELPTDKRTHFGFDKSEK